MTKRVLVDGRWERVPGNPGRTGTEHYNARLTWRIVESIRERAARGEPLSEIADDIGVSRSTISNVVLMRTWKPEKRP